MWKARTLCVMGLLSVLSIAGESAILTGSLFDGRDLIGNPIVGGIALFEDDRTTPLAISGGAGANLNEREIDSSGNFSIEFDAPASGIVVLVANSDLVPGIQTSSIAVDISTGSATLTVYLSTTLITGKVIDPNGEPVSIDVWVMRNNSGDGTTFDPYAIAGGRDFLPPAMLSGVNFGIDTDALGFFSIPVQMPNALFNLIFAVDRASGVFMQNQVLVNVPAGTTITQDVQLDFLAGRETGPPTFEAVREVFAMRGCSALGCHGSGIGIDPLRGPFFLSNDTNGRSAVQDYQAVLARIDIENPTASLLLQKPGPPEGNHGGGELFASEDDPDFMTLLAWISSGAAGPLNPTPDLDGDAVVDANDLLLFLKEWHVATAKQSEANLRFRQRLAVSKP